MHILESRPWSALPSGLLRHGVKRNGVTSCELLHRLVMHPAPDEFVDHINHNGADNRRCNLRVCTNSQNQANTRINRRNKSGFKGVSWKASKQRWRAMLYCGGQAYELGYFREKDDAAAAYRKAAVEMFGEYAYTGDRRTMRRG